MYSLVMNTSLNSITCGWRSMRWLRISASTYLCGGQQQQQQASATRDVWVLCECQAGGRCCATPSHEATAAAALC
jgi:hypothetical protein